MRKLAFLVVCLALSVVRAPLAHALDLEKFHQLVVFGDSLSDNGNLFAITEAEGIKPPQPPFPPYGETFDGTGPFPGRFTDGQNWVDYFPQVANSFGVYVPSVNAFFKDHMGTNFAIGGSTSEVLASQISTYLNSPIGQNPANDLCVIWIGANDFFNPTPISPKVTAENIRNGIAQLSRAGARTFIVINAPDISLTPRVMATPTIIQAAKQFVFTVNALLEVEILPFAWLHRITVEIVDINAIFIPLVLNPSKFGFTNSTGAAIDPTTYALLVTDPNDYVFWDGFHPTTGAHLIAAEFIYRSIAFRPHFPETLRVPLVRLDLSETLAPR